MIIRSQQVRIRAERRIDPCYSVFRLARGIKLGKYDYWLNDKTVFIDQTKRYKLRKWSQQPSMEMFIPDTICIVKGQSKPAKSPITR
jgi:hypothetical protein